MLTAKDLELIEKIIYRNGDDIAVAMSRSFERLEERIEALETRLTSRITDMGNKNIEDGQEISDTLADLKNSLAVFMTKIKV